MLLPKTISRVVSLDASDFALAFYNTSKTFDASLELNEAAPIDLWFVMRRADFLIVRYACVSEIC